MNKPLISLLLISIFIGSCVPVPASPTPPTPATATRTIAPSETPPPTQTVVPTATPYLPLQTDGPYLLYVNGRNSLIIMDADGIGRKHIKLPDNGHFIWQFEKSVSPNGKWLAYFTGSIEEPYDLALNLLNISDETSYFITNIIAPGFPENLEPVTETIRFSEHDTDCSENPACRLRVIEINFRTGIRNFDWSSDSKHIAFAAQIDDPSSDIYIYSVEEGTIKRLTNEIENVGFMIEWSPNGEKILYESLVSGSVYLSRYIHIADPKLDSPQNPKSVDGGLFWFEYGWINQDSYLIYSGGEGSPPHRLRIINPETQDVKEIWEYSAESFYVDLKRQKIILSPYGRTYLLPEPEIGVYAISFDGKYQKISDELVFFLEEQDAVNQYIASDEQHQLIGISLDGSVIRLSRGADYYVPPSSSPDGKWIVITSETETEIYSGELQLIKSLGIHATEIIWRPDSEGVFLFSEPKLYYLSMDNTNLSEICGNNDCLPFEYIWLP